MNKLVRRSSSCPKSRSFEYQILECRRLLACSHIGEAAGGILVADDATGPGYIMYSEQDVQSRFSMSDDNASHFLAVRIHGGDWQFNDDTNWIDFEPTPTDRLMTEVNFTGDSVSNSVSLPIVNGIISANRFPDAVGREVVESDLWFNPNRFFGAPNEGEFEVLGTCFDKTPTRTIPDEIASNQKQILTGLLAYESRNGEFPRLAALNDVGRNFLSWRVEILPFLGFADLYNRFNHNEPWNSQQNASLIAEMPDVFASPNVQNGLTPFQAVAGEGTLFRRSGTPVELRDVGDGAANTVAIVEADADRAVIWTQPADLSFNASDPFDGMGENGASIFRAITLNGQVLNVQPQSSSDNFANLLQIDDGNLVDLAEFELVSDIKANLQFVGFGIQNYESTFGEYPKHAIYNQEGTAPLLSWRVSLLPFIGEQYLYEQFRLDEPWDSKHNLSLLPLMPSVYAKVGLPTGFTNVLATSGAGTMFELADTDQVPIDGARQTTLVVQADFDQAVEWTKPEDWVFDPGDPTDGLGGNTFSQYSQPRAGFYAVFADATVRLIPNSISDSNFTAMVQRADGVVVDFDDAPNEGLTVETQLRTLGLAALNFESAYQQFPRHATYTVDGTQALLSWRVQLLPFIGEEVLYNQFNLNEAWDSPHNVALLDDMPEIFKSPEIDDGLTAFQALIGDNTMFPITLGVSLRPALRIQITTKIGQLSNDLSNTS